MNKSTTNKSTESKSTVNHALAQGALQALTARGFETQKGYCSRWCRQVCEFVYGDARYNSLWRPDKDPSALDAAYAFEKAGLAVSTAKLEIGDLLFKLTGEFGHVGILTVGGVAENSSYHWKRHPGDARGIRSLEQFGAFQIAIRLPSPSVTATKTKIVKTKVVAQPTSPSISEAPLLVWNGTAFPVIFQDGRPYIQLAAVCENSGQIVTATTNRMDEHPPRFYVTSHLRTKAMKSKIMNTKAANTSDTKAQTTTIGL